MDEAIATTIPWTVFLDVTVNPSWLTLARGVRDAILAEHLAPLLERHAPVTRMEWFDADAYSATPTDIGVITTTDLDDWATLLTAIKDSPLIAHGHYTIDRVLVTRSSTR
ncbi:darcynin family protein [Streptomyces stramineus]|uniref:Uncharacterized protein n=1 Tax=Streptomyces stramineus TaxID=173861 RepID=A0ABP3J7Q8_9ACTN